MRPGIENYSDESIRGKIEGLNLPSPAREKAIHAARLGEGIANAIVEAIASFDRPAKGKAKVATVPAYRVAS